MLFGVPIFPDRERSVLSLFVWSWTNKQRTGGASVNGRACCADPTGKPLMEVSTCESLSLSIVLLSQGVVVLVGCWYGKSRLLNMATNGDDSQVFAMAEDDLQGNGGNG